MAREPTHLVDPRTDSGRRCFAEQELSAFSAGRLSEPETLSISRHLASCQTCSERLDRLPRADGISSILNNCQAGHPVLDEPECARLQSALEALPARARDAARKAKEATVSSRLAADDSEPSPGGATPGLAGDETVSCPLPLPSRIRRYEIQRLLGQGSFGRVFLALDADLHRQVALKVPRAGLVFRQPLIDAFLQEARTAARLNHPGIVTIYEVGYDRDFGCFIAMEYVEGKSLKQLQTAARISPAEAANYVAQAAEAVHYAHKQKLVHRDIKPANLLVNAEGRLKVADFGLALFEEEQRERAGEFAGTLAYISPEQLRGQTQHLDGRTDVYSLGVVLYELLTGKRPFQGATDDLTDDILHRPPKPLRQIDDTISPELERICLRCLAKNAADRFPTAKDLADDLNRTLAPSLPVADYRPLWAWPAGAVILLLLAVLAPLGIWQWGSVPGGKTPAAAELEESTPPAPRNLDFPGLHRTWLRLMDHEPFELIPRSHAKNAWEPQPSQEEVWIDAEYFYPLSLGMTTSDHYILRAEISQNVPTEAGLFCGLQPTTPRGNNRRWILQTLTIRGYPNDRFFLQRNSLVLTESPSGLSKERSNMLGSFEVEPPDLTRAPLELHVLGGAISEVRWFGRQISELSDHSLKLDPPLPCNGQLGVAVFRGRATFHSAKFMNLRNSTP